MSESPTLVIGGRRLKGRYEHVVGTDMIFDPDNETMAGYVGSSTRRLIFEHDK